MTWPLVHHRESDTSYCTRHFAVADADGNCAACEAEIPRRTVFIDELAVIRWRELIADLAFPAVLEALQRIVVEGREIEGTGKFPNCNYYCHPDFYPEAVVVVKHKGRYSGEALVTVIRLEVLERLRVEYQSAKP